jgi:putative PEP-CTERM system TPR-repeat lipoprotein
MLEKRMLQMLVSPVGRSLFTVLCAVLVISCGQSTSEQDYLDRAKEYISQSDPSAASIELKNALLENPENNQTRLKLAKLYFDFGDLPSAEKELLRVKKGFSTEIDNEHSPLLARIWMRQGKSTQVLDMDLEGLEAQSLAVVLAAQSLAFMSRSDLDSASRKLDLAVAMAPDSFYVSLIKAQFLFVSGDFSGADNLLKKIHTIDPEDAASWALHGDIKQAKQDFELADEYYSKAIQLDDSALAYQMKQVFLRIQLRHLEQAQKGVDALLAYAPQSTQVNYAQGLILFFSSKFEQAVSSFLVAEPDKFRFPDLLMYLAMAHYQLGNLDKAYIYAQDFYALETNRLEANKLLATLRVHFGKLGEAEQLISTVLQQSPNDIDALNILANALIAQARIDEAIEVLARVVELDPESASAQVRLGSGYASAGRSEEAVALIQETINLNPEYGRADTLLVLTYLNNKDYTNAMDVAKSYQQRQPASPTPLLLMGRIYLNMGDKEAAKGVFEDILEIEPGNPAANHNLATMAYSQKEFDKARAYYQAVLTAHPHFISTLMALALLEGLEKNYAEMVALLEEAIEFNPEVLQPRVTLGRYQLRIGRADKVLVLFTGLSDAQRNNLEVLRLMGQAQLAEGLYADARYSFETLLSLEPPPHSAQDYRLLGLAFKGLGETEKMRLSLKTAWSLEPDSLDAHLARAMDAFSRADAVALEQEFSAIEELAPENSQYKQLQAAYARVKGDHKAAVKLFEQAYESSPSTVSMLNLQKEYELAGNEAASQALLQSWVNGHADDKSARLALASRYMALGDQEKVVREYSAILDNDKDNVVALNNLAWSLLKEQPQAALEYAEKAAKIASKSPDVLDTLALAQSANKQHVKARQTVRSLLKIAPNNPNYLYHSALISSDSGRKDEAIATLQSLLKDDADFQLRDEAVKLMRTLSASQ